MNEKINQTTLIYDNYKGNDLYCDGEIEDVILDIVKEKGAEEFPKIIESSANWPIMYHLSPVRENILRWYPFCEHANILEIGSGCGAVSGSLYREGNKITCIDLSKKRSTINAHRHKRENMKIHVGNFEDIKLGEKFDYVTLIGVLEYGGSYIHSDTPYNDFIKKAKGFLKPNGKIIIAIENKLGLKYFAGCKEDHVSSYFEGIEGYSQTNGIKTFTKKELGEMLKAAGFVDVKFYYPYPDYKFAHTIYSDEHLPKHNELNDNLRNFDMERMELFNEQKVYNTLLENDLFSQFSNSFLIEASIEESKQSIFYVKYSQSNRAIQFQVKTTIEQVECVTYVYKEALHPQSSEHIAKMEKAYHRLQELYKNTMINVVSCKMESHRLKFEFAQGRSLEEHLYALAEVGDYKTMLSEIERYFDALKASAYVGKLNHEEQRMQYFGEVYEGSSLILDNANIDAVFGNVKIEDEKYTLFDYEWVMDFSMPFNFIKYRCIFYFIQGNQILKNLDLYSWCGLKKDELPHYEQMEACFQSYVRKEKLVDDQLHAKLGQITISKDEVKEACLLFREHKTMQVYLNYGEGYQEKDSLHLTCETSGAYKKIKFKCGSGVQQVRIDPMNQYGIVRIHKLYIYDGKGTPCKNSKFETNGRHLGDQAYIYLTKDPMLVLEKVNVEEKIIVFEAEVWPINEDVACLIDKLNVGKKFLKGR